MIVFIYMCDGVKLPDIFLMRPGEKARGVHSFYRQMFYLGTKLGKL